MGKLVSFGSKNVTETKRVDKSLGADIKRSALSLENASKVSDHLSNLSNEDAVVLAGLANAYRFLNQQFVNIWNRDKDGGDLQLFADDSIKYSELSKKSAKEGYFLLAALQEITNQSEKQLSLDLTEDLSHLSKDLLKIFRYDPEKNTIKINDPENPERVYDVKLDADAKSDSPLPLPYLQYFLLAIRNMTRLVKNKLKKMPENPDLRQDIDKFFEFRGNLIKTLRATPFSRAKEGVRDIRSSINSIQNSKQNEMIERTLEVLDYEDVDSKDLLNRLSKELVSINQKIDQKIFLGKNEDGAIDYLGAIQILGADRLIGRSEAIFGDPKNFFRNHYTRNTIQLIKKIISDERIVKKIANNKDINYSEFIKKVSSALSDSSLNTYRVMIQDLEALERAGTDGDIPFIKEVLANRRELLLLLMASKFGLQDKSTHRDYLKDEYKQVVLRGDSGELDYDKLDLIRPVELKQLLNKLTIEYRNRHAGLISKDKSWGVDIEGYRNLLGTRTKWINTLMEAMVHLVAAPADIKIVGREDKMSAITDFFVEISSEDILTAQTFEEIAHNNAYIHDLRLTEENIDLINKFRTNTEEKSVDSKTGFSTREVFRERELVTFRRWILETELFALTSVIGSKGFDSKSYKRPWQKKLFDSRVAHYSSMTLSQRKEIFKEKVAELEDLLEGNFDIQEFVNRHSTEHFLEKMVSDLVKKAEPKAIARNIEVLTLLSKIKYRWQNVFTSEEGSENAYNRFEVFLENVIKTLKSSNVFPSRKIHDICSNLSTYQYLLTFIDKSLAMSSSFNTAPELAISLYCLALTSMQTPKKRIDFLSESFGYRRKIFSYFFDPEFRARVKKLSPELYEIILKQHSKQVNHYIQELGKFTSALGNRINSVSKDIDASQIDQFTAEFRDLLVNYYYPLELAISKLPPKLQGNYEIIGVKPNLEDLIEIDPNIVVDLSEAAYKEEDKKTFIAALIKSTADKAKILSQVSNYANSPASFENFLANLVNKLKKPSIHPDKQVDLLASSQNVKRDTIKYLFAKLYKSWAGSSFYVRLAYSLIKEKGMLKSVVDLISRGQTGHLFIGDDLFRSQDGMKLALSLKQFYDCTHVLQKLNLVDVEKSVDVVNNTFEEKDREGISKSLDNIREILNMKHIFYKTPIKEIRSTSSEDMSAIQLAGWRLKLLNAFMNVKDFSPNLRTSANYLQKSSTSVFRDDYDWLPMVERSELKANSIGTEDSTVVAAIDEIAENSLSQSYIHSRQYPQNVKNAA